MGYPIQQSTTAQPLTFLMVLASDHVTGATGLSPTVTISKNGGAFASPSVSPTEIGNGWYKLAGNATDNNTLGPLLLHATAATADPVDVTFTVVAYNPQSATNLGLSGIGTAQTGDAYAYVVANLGAAGAAATALAQASLWTSTIAGRIDAAVSTRLAAASANATGLLAMTNEYNSAGNISSNLVQWRADIPNILDSGNVPIGTITVGSVTNVTGDVQGKVLGGGTSAITGIGAATVEQQAAASGFPFGLALSGGVTATCVPAFNTSDGNIIYGSGGTVSPVFVISNGTRWTVTNGGHTWVGPLASADPLGTYVVGGQTNVTVAAAAPLNSALFEPIETTGYPATFPEFMGWLRARFANKVVLDNSGSTIKVYEQDGATVMTTQSASSTVTSETQGGAT